MTYKELNAMEAVFEGTADWTCTECFRPHAPDDYHCMCGQIKPNGRKHIPALLKEVRALKKKLRVVQIRLRRHDGHVAEVVP